MTAPVDEDVTKKDINASWSLRQVPVGLGQFGRRNLDFGSGIYGKVIVCMHVCMYIILYYIILYYIILYYIILYYIILYYIILYYIILYYIILYYIILYIYICIFLHLYAHLFVLLQAGATWGFDVVDDK